MSLFFRLFTMLCISSLFFVSKSYSYSEGAVNINGAFFPQVNPSNDKLNPVLGLSLSADIMNNIGIDFGLGHSWANSYQAVDARLMYWFNGHMNGFYTGLSSHFKYEPNFGVGSGIIVGHSLPLTEYINFDSNIEAGYSYGKYFRIISDPFYCLLTMGLSISFM